MPPPVPIGYQAGGAVTIIFDYNGSHVLSAKEKTTEI